MLGDKGFDADPFIDALERRDIAPVIPPKANRKVPRSCDFVLYCERNLVEPMALEGRRGVFGEIKPPASGLQLPTGGEYCLAGLQIAAGACQDNQIVTSRFRESEVNFTSVRLAAFARGREVFQDLGRQQPATLCATVSNVIQRRAFIV